MLTWSKLGPQSTRVSSLRNRMHADCSSNFQPKKQLFFCFARSGFFLLWWANFADSLMGRIVGAASPSIWMIFVQGIVSFVAFMAANAVTFLLSNSTILPGPL